MFFCDEREMTRTTRCCLRNLSRLAFAMESCSASTSSAASSSSFLSETSRRLFQTKRATLRAGRTVAGARRVVPSSSSIATASRVVLEHKDGKEDDDVKTIAVTFTEKTGEEITVKAKVGESLMEAAHENDVELEGRIFVLLFSRCEERERERERGGCLCSRSSLSLSPRLSRGALSRARFARSARPAR